MVSRKDVPFGVKKSQHFETPNPQTPKTAKICPILVGTWKLISLNFAFNIGGLTSKQPLFFIGAQ